MTESEVKRIEDQIKDLQSVVSNYYKDQKAVKIIQKEENLLGKSFKKTDENGETDYFKPISLMHVNTPYVCHGIRFKLPIAPGFDKRGMFRMARDFSDFDYVFDDDLILYLDNEEIKKLEDEYEAITQDEFEAALATLMLQVTDFSKKPLTLKRVMGDEYEEKIKRILSDQERKNKDVPEEN